MSSYLSPFELLCLNFSSEIVFFLQKEIIFIHSNW